MGVLHDLDGFGNGLALLHLGPEGGFILVVAAEGNVLGIAVNAACALCEQSGTGLAAAAKLHTLAHCHPNEAVAEVADGVVLDVTAVDVGAGSAVADRPTVVEVVGGDAAVGGEAEIGGVAGLDAVAVPDNNALIGHVDRDLRTGRLSRLDQGVGAAGGVGDGLSLVLVLIGEVVVVAVVGTNEQNVGGIGGVACRTVVLNGGLGLEHLDAFACGNGGCAGLELVVQTVVVGALHAVNGEEETVFGEISKAVLINVLDVQSRLKNGGDDFLLFIAG